MYQRSIYNYTQHPCGERVLPREEPVVSIVTCSSPDPPPQLSVIFGHPHVNALMHNIVANYFRVEEKSSRQYYTVNNLLDRL